MVITIFKAHHCIDKNKIQALRESGEILEQMNRWNLTPFHGEQPLNQRVLWLRIAQVNV